MMTDEASVLLLAQLAILIHIGTNNSLLQYLLLWLLTKKQHNKIDEARRIDSLYCHAPVSAGHETNSKWVVGFLSTDAFDQKILFASHTRCSSNILQ